jgi:hypothetical protein
LKKLKSLKSGNIITYDSLWWSIILLGHGHLIFWDKRETGY